MGGIKIMVVDDTAFMRTILRNILVDLGHQVVVEASNGIDAVNKYVHFRPDLVFLDITMPELDGISTIKKINEIDSTAKIIICSALAYREMIIEAIRYGASDYLLKPINKDRIDIAINRIFSNRVIKNDND